MLTFDPAAAFFQIPHSGGFCKVGWRVFTPVFLRQGLRGSNGYWRWGAWYDALWIRLKRGDNLWREDGIEKRNIVGKSREMGGWQVIGSAFMYDDTAADVTQINTSDLS